MTPSKVLGRRPVPATTRQDGRNASPIYLWWTKRREYDKPDKEEIWRLDDDAVIQLVRRGLRREAQGVSGERKAFIAAIMGRLEDEGIWPAFAKTCRSEHQE
ncbi:unnamed protein product [Sphagnum jensenii]